MNKIIYRQKFQISVIIGIVALIYSKLLSGFFQQDEWFSYGWYIIHRHLNFVDNLKFLFASSIGHYNPLTNIVQFKLYELWGMNFTNFAVLGILLHLVNVIAFYFFTKALFKKDKLLPFLMTILFGLTASIYQGVSWVVADISTLTASIFGLVSATYYLKYFDNYVNKYLIYSLLLIMVSLLFKEISIGLFILYFGYSFFLDRSNRRVKNLLLIATFGLLYITFRLLMMFSPGITGDKLVTASQSIGLILYNLVTIPFKTIFQILLPSDFMMLISTKISTLFSVNLVETIGVAKVDMFSIDKVMDFISISGGLLTSLFVLKIAKKYNTNNQGKILLFGLSWVIVNSLIFSLSPETSGSIIAIDSRNLYFSAVGMSIIVVLVVNLLALGNPKKLMLFLLLVLLFNTYWLNNNLNKVVLPGQIRKTILIQIGEQYPKFPEKVAFLVLSNTPYYGLSESEKIPPFQSGFGQTLLVWYYHRENFPDTFYKDRFLWELTSQGYKDDQGRGFGYFREYDQLKDAVKINKLKPESVIAFRWDSNTNSLTDITIEIRKKLKNEIAK